jgi:hypothetical protein
VMRDNAWVHIPDRGLCEQLDGWAITHIRVRPLHAAHQRIRGLRITLDD